MSCTFSLIEFRISLPLADTNPGCKGCHVAQRMILFAIGHCSGLVRQVRDTIRCTINLLGELIHQINCGLEKRLEKFVHSNPSSLVVSTDGAEPETGRPPRASQAASMCDASLKRKWRGERGAVG